MKEKEKMANYAEIPLTGVAGAGRVAKVSVKDYPLLARFSWYYKEGYALANINGKEVRMHRLVLNENNPDFVVDHRNRDRLDNRRENLRRFTLKQNANNRCTNRGITAFGETKTVAEWSEDPRCAVNYNTLLGRIRREVWPEYAILAPEKIHDLIKETDDQ